MKWSFEEGYSPEPGTADGQVSYLQGGQLVTRVRRQPVYPRTAAQSAEVGGVVAASRAYAYDLSPEDAETYAGESCEGLNKFESWVWVWSLMQWLQQSIELVPSGGFFNECPVLDDAVLDVEGGELSVEVSAPSSSEDSSIRLRASRPMRRGRRPRPEDMRTIGTIPAGVSTDIADAYVAAFGGLPAMDTFTLFGLVVADPVNPAGSCECEWEVEWTESGEISCTATTALFFIFPFTSFSCDVFCSDGSAPGSFNWQVSVLTPGWTIDGTDTIPNNTGSMVSVLDTSGATRTEPVCLRFTKVGSPGVTCESCTADISVFGI